VAKVGFKDGTGHLKATERPGRGSPKDARGTSLTPPLSGRQPRRAKLRSAVPAYRQLSRHFVPVVSSFGAPIMPTTPARARKWVNAGKAIGRWSSGIWYVKLVEETGAEKQEIVVGIDPGSKKEGYTIKSEAHTFLNVQCDAVTWVKKAVETRRMMRRSRRNRKTPCRKPRFNKKKGGLAPSTRARWGLKLRVVRWLGGLFPVSYFVVEDIKAKAKKGCRKWNRSFSPLEVGKKWFYEKLEKMAPLETKFGYETAKMRASCGLKKTSRKLSSDFSAHCVDSWVLANSRSGGHIVPDNTRVFCVVPIRFHRRQLHALQANAVGTRRNYGGTRSLGFRRGSLVWCEKRGYTYVGGNNGERISLHNIGTGKRICQNVEPSDCRLFSVLKFRTYG
jgi:hypothetical protein